MVTPGSRSYALATKVILLAWSRGQGILQSFNLWSRQATWKIISRPAHTQKKLVNIDMVKWSRPILDGGNSWPQLQVELHSP